MIVITRVAIDFLCIRFRVCILFIEIDAFNQKYFPDPHGSHFYDGEYQVGLLQIKIKKSKSDIENSGSVKIKSIMTVDNDDVDPLLKMPVALRIWISPWHDKNDDIETGYIYVVAERGRWLVSP